MALYVVLVMDTLGEDPDEVLEVIGPFGTEANALYHAQGHLLPDCRGEVMTLEFPT